MTLNCNPWGRDSRSQSLLFPLQRPLAGPAPGDPQGWSSGKKVPAWCHSCGKVGGLRGRSPPKRVDAALDHQGLELGYSGGVEAQPV